MLYSDKSVLIVGMGISGISVARYLLEEGAAVTCYDEKDIDLSKIPEIVLEKSHCLFNIAPDKIVLDNYDMIAVSPGVSPSNQIVQKAKLRGISIATELEIALRNIKVKRLIAVTGTNGKTTTTQLIGHILNAQTAGNIGDPLCDKIRHISEDETLILEVSSYQIIYSESLVPDIAVLLNIFPEHLSWHDGFENYRKAKLELLKRQSVDQYSVINAEIEGVSNYAEVNIKSEKLFFSTERELPEGIFMSESGDIIYSGKEGIRKTIMRKDEIPFRERHNIENLMAALAVKIIAKDSAPLDLTGFELGEHRMEKVAEIKGRQFINDSKATNMHSVFNALESIRKPVILLLGGRTKGYMHPELPELIKKKAVLTVLFGESRRELDEILGSEINKISSPTLKKAIKTAWDKSESGQVILLSPGGSSFDEFENYKHRGSYFKSIVNELGNNETDF